MRAWVLFSLSLLILCYPSYSQGSSSTKSGGSEGTRQTDAFFDEKPGSQNSEAAKQVDSYFDGLRTAHDPVSRAQPNGADSEIPGEQRKFSSFTYEYNMRLFNWQLFSSRILFFAVIALVLAGISFSGIQFRVALKAMEVAAQVQARAGRHTETTEPTDPGEMNVATKIEASLHGLKITSPVLGVVILAMSLLFFYLYLAYVYPIKVVNW
jgi:hypothetical protein